MSKPQCTGCKDFFAQDGMCGTCLLEMRNAYAAELRKLRAKNMELEDMYDDLKERWENNHE